MVELLAPVGSPEAFTAAVESGADALYLAGKQFGARAYAANFEDEQLVDAVRFAHLRGVLVYVTVNTLVDNEEMHALVEYIHFLYVSGVDGIIVQDMGVARLVRQYFPDMPIHASTQMTIHNLAGVELLATAGFSRVVLAREMSLDEITNICKNTNIEIEIFVHGALCICYSGQCLMSSLIGGRSGNRGRCAQPCRLPYRLTNKKGEDLLAQCNAGEYLLSPKDFNTLEVLPQLLASGIKSLKIEGRMKRAEYVAVVVDSYRRAVDNFFNNPSDYTVDYNDWKNIAQIFNRDFTTAYLQGRPGRNMMSDRRPNNRGVYAGRVIKYLPQTRTAIIRTDEPLNIGDIIEFWVKVGGRVNVTINSMTVDGQNVTCAVPNTEVAIPVPSSVKVNDRVFKVYDAQLSQYARAFFQGPNAVRRIAIDVSVKVLEGQPLLIQLKDEDGFTSVAATQFVAEKAIKRPLSCETIKAQINRLGSTIFVIRNYECFIDGDLMVPVSEINEARRQAIEKLEQARLAEYDRPVILKPTISFPVNREVARKQVKLPLLVANVDTVTKLSAALNNGADVIMFGGESFNNRPIEQEEYRQAVDVTRNAGKSIILSTPRIIKGWQYKQVKSDIELFASLKPDYIGVSNPGTLEIVKGITTLPLHGDYPLNIFNDFAIELYRDYGVSSITLSPELNFEQIGKFSRGTILECIVHGHLTLMISEYCVIGSFMGDAQSGKCMQACRRDTYYLKDRMNELFPIVTDQFCRMHILNAKELNMLPHVARFYSMGIDKIRIESKNYSVQQLGEIIRKYRVSLDNLANNYDLNSINHLTDDMNMTRGHYFRGVK